MAFATNFIFGAAEPIAMTIPMNRIHYAIKARIHYAIKAILPATHQPPDASDSSGFAGDEAWDRAGNRITYGAPIMPRSFYVLFRTPC